MSHLLWISVAAVGLVLLVVGSVVAGVHFLVWVGGAVLAVGFLLFLARILLKTNST